ncbi:putative bifunctional diguanylate cyclase/phosphodiesterase [Comamonas testosteroni]|uniref:putative bifunctional diguanylate cyclase/phosphodiesterase n=1 Tax=Comamonas testosteroni TaxID=285 RepID=UPI0005B33DA9|nr:EAL domain-containing protein [Comamonas testosteroni]
MLFERPLLFLHAFSDDEARQLLREGELAVVMLDLASQQADARLELADFIRHTAALRNTRIILLSGQPGQEPGLDALIEHDISDCRLKAELTADRLRVVVATAIRSYKQLCAADTSRGGLEHVLRSSASLLEIKDCYEFASGVLIQLAALLKVAQVGVVCAQELANPDGCYFVQAATGRFSELIGRPLELLPLTPELGLLRKSVEGRCNVYGDSGGLALHIGHDDGQNFVVFIDVPRHHAVLHPQLLDVFCANLSTLLHNRGLLGRLKESAYHDPLVNLPNRAHFVEAVDECARQGLHDYILALIDIDDFSATNDLMGHLFGDRLLERVARCLEDVLPGDVLLARLGADTFGVLGATGQVQPRRLLECVRQPLSIDGVPYKVSLTCGYVLLPQEFRAGADLVKDATIALKRAKRDHRGQELRYSDQMGAEARSRALLLSELREAIENRELFLVYQPQLNLVTRSVGGIEALLRWRTEDGRFVPPDKFIPVAEHSGLIVALGQWVLMAACAAMRELLDAGVAPQRIAVNVSTVQLQDPGFLEIVCAALASSGLRGDHLELEITESVAALPTDLLKSTLSALRAEGVSIAIDDFGTGYSSLSYLEQLPLDRIKIDRSFVCQLGEPDGARIAEMVVQLGRKLGLSVLAEGIEDATVCQALLAMDCYEGQGYYIAKPMDKDVLLAWLQAHCLDADVESRNHLMAPPVELSFDSRSVAAFGAEESAVAILPAISGSSRHVMRERDRHTCA